MTKRSPFRCFKLLPEVIRLAVRLYIRFPLSLRKVKDLLQERGIDISNETVRVLMGEVRHVVCGREPSLAGRASARQAVLAMISRRNIREDPCTTSRSASRAPPTLFSS